MESLARIENVIRASDGDAIRARWQFGCEVLAQRIGKQLPKGLLAEICQQAKISHMELSRRVRFAEAYNEIQLEHLCSTSILTWTAIVKGLPKKRTIHRTPPKPRAVPTAATVKEADRVVELISRPDVATELRAREKADGATRKAQAAIERRERNEARRQKEEDLLNQQVQQALRQQLINGDGNWQNLTEQMEICADTVTRYLDIMDGLTVPDQLRLKRLDSQLGQLQQTLHQLRGRLWPDHRAVIDIGRTGVINIP
jgi:hypothetical protein